ncbi:hypothetical protein [Vibrio rarus]|uniref:hypothetical protein n=1 Tax=Vibrio rarus TaxID=413403 RepID=UPI0021C40AF9|nr:hypothetical protein [Vibrio rarus]
MSNTTTLSDAEQIQQLKNQWMLSQIDVDFPTRESQLGSACYLDVMEQNSAIMAFEGPTDPALTPKGKLNWLKVDFHKLTVLFSQFYASHSAVAEASRDYLQEFLAQIILDDNSGHSLWVGLSDSAVSGCCIVSEKNQHLLISDLLLNTEYDLAQEVPSIITGYTAMGHGVTWPVMVCPISHIE